MNKDSGGPAFPAPHLPRIPGAGAPPIGIGNSAQTGMTLRDYFAAAALQGILANSNIVLSKSADVVLAVYELADEMLTERNK